MISFEDFFRKQYFFVVYLLFFCSLFTYSQKYSFTDYSIKEGLSNASVNDLFQDSRGLIWLATNGGGVCQFDGYSFYTLTTNQGLCGNNVNAIAEDSFGSLWFGTNSGVCVFDGKRIVDFSDSIYGSSVNNLYADSAGLMWLFTETAGVIQIQTKNGKKLAGNEALKAVRDIAQDSYGRYWTLSETGLTILDPMNNMKSIDLGQKLALPKALFSSIAAGPNNEMWIGTSNKGAFLLKYDSLSCYEKRSYNSYFDNIDDNVVSVTIDRNGDAWLGTNNGGVVYIDYPFVKKLHEGNGLESNQIKDVIEDAEGNIWIATKEHGVKSFPGWHFVHYDDESGLSEDNITSIVQDLKGNFWCTGLNGLYSMKVRNDEIRLFNVTLPEAYRQAEITQVIFPNATEMFFGTANMGLIQIIDNELILHDEESGLNDNSILSLCYSSDTVLWIGSKSGLAKFSNDTTIDLSENNKRLKSGVNAIIEDLDGAIWLATNEGIVFYQQGVFYSLKDDGELIDRRINSLMLLPSGNILLGTLGEGLFSIQKSQEELSIQEYLNTPNLLSSNIYSLSLLNDSVYLVGTDKGANRIVFDKETDKVNSVVSFNGANGFLNLECNTNSILRDNEGRIWFGTKTGLTCYDASREKNKRELPQIYFTGMDVNFEAVKWQSEEHSSDEWFAVPANLKLKHKENYVSFSYSGVYYSEGLIYQYFLEGLDKEWSLPTSQRMASFSKLNPGRYNFKVRAITKSGLKSAERSFSFTIKPPFWRTWWFILVFLASIAYAIIWYVKYRERALKQAKILLESTVQERTEEIQSQKTHIEQQKKSLTDSIEYAKKIQDAVIPEPSNIQNYFADYFILYLPRDIVSGDFYWFGEVENKFVFSVADCTGHGVPGAFMSMLGIRLLNEIVMERQVTEPNEILNQLRAGVINALKQDNESDTRDGMDMTICTFDKAANKLYFAGAYNSLWIIRGEEVITVKGDRMPVAIYVKLEEFTCQEIDCQPGDRLYMLSDGYADQFGGPDTKKYMSKRLRKKLESISTLPMKKQQEILLKEFYEWKGEMEQIDDVSLMGVQI